jgi:hypothetical protein
MTGKIMPLRERDTTTVQTAAYAFGAVLRRAGRCRRSGCRQRPRPLWPATRDHRARGEGSREGQPRPRALLWREVRPPRLAAGIERAARVARLVAPGFRSSTRV